MDASLLATFVACWMIVAFIMLAAYRLSRKLIDHVAIFLASIGGTYVGGSLLSQWINDTLLPLRRIGFNLDPTAEPSALLPLYLLCLHVACWLGVVVFLFVLMSHMRRRQTHSL